VSLELLAAVAACIAVLVGLVLVLMVGEVIDLLNATADDELERARLREELRRRR
jgi:hypothetical protein